MQFESQKKEEEMTTAELEEIEVRKRRAEGTPCTKENFLAWKAKFEKEMEEKEEEEAKARLKEKASTGKKKGGTSTKKDDEKESRLTGYEQFCGKMGILNLDAIEKAADEAENDPKKVDVEELDVDEDLFDDDEDLDDLDFDSDDDVDI